MIQSENDGRSDQNQKDEVARTGRQKARHITCVPKQEFPNKKTKERLITSEQTQDCQSLLHNTIEKNV